MIQRTYSRLTGALRMLEIEHQSPFECICYINEEFSGSSSLYTAYKVAEDIFLVVNSNEGFNSRNSASEYSTTVNLVSFCKVVESEMIFQNDHFYQGDHIDGNSEFFDKERVKDLIKYLKVDYDEYGFINKIFQLSGYGDSYVTECEDHDQDYVDRVWITHDPFVTRSQPKCILRGEARLGYQEFMKPMAQVEELLQRFKSLVFGCRRTAIITMMKLINFILCDMVITGKLKSAFHAHDIEEFDVFKKHVTKASGFNILFHTGKYSNATLTKGTCTFKLNDGKNVLVTVTYSSTYRYNSKNDKDLSIEYNGYTEQMMAKGLGLSDWSSKKIRKFIVACLTQCLPLAQPSQLDAYVRSQND
ncbi:translation initiation factor 3 subunit H [Acrasis kona]|uniref:Translation initiation factor 3 subunit H n=1 Tax=Acrasis kona TaxID=1008807 RepID=A0AAW2ZBP6_9EUKA